MATESDKINTAALGTLVAVGALATLAISLGVYALVRFEVSQLEAQRADVASEAFHTLSAEQEAKLTGNPKWVSKKKGVVTVPIDRAIRSVLSDLARDPASATEPGQPDAAAKPHDAFGTAGAAAVGSATTARSGTPASSAAPVPAGSVTLPQAPTSATPPVPKGSGAPAAPKAPKGPTPTPAAPAPTSTQ
jgi:hypothetical protein